MKFKVVWINLLMGRQRYDAHFKNGKPVQYKTHRAAEQWARTYILKAGIAGLFLV